VATLTPYGFWLRTHALHHAHAGNLDQRGFGDIITLTSQEFLALTPLHRLIYRLYRSPWIMFGLIPDLSLHGALIVFRSASCAAARSPGSARWERMPAIAAIVALMMWLVGVGPFLLVQGPVVAISASIAVWFFYVQHQFEDTLWAHDGVWSFHEAALHGSSHYELAPRFGLVHGQYRGAPRAPSVDRIPFYRLPQVLRDHPQLASVGRLTFFRAFDARGSLYGTSNRAASYPSGNCARAARCPLRNPSGRRRSAMDASAGMRRLSASPFVTPAVLGFQCASDR